MSAGAAQEFRNWVPPWGDYPYANAFLFLPQGRLPAMGPLTAPPRPSEEVGTWREVVGEIITEDGRADDRETLFWFRWVTGHQLAFLYWKCLERCLDAWLNCPPKERRGAAVLLLRSTYLIQGYSAALLYTGSCPRGLYQGVIRRFMALFHKGFSGKWARDYRELPAMIKQVLEEAGNAGTDPGIIKGLRQAFIDNHQVHYGLAKKLVPDGASLRKEFQEGAGHTQSVRPEHQAMFDNFFLVRRTQVAVGDLAEALARRHHLIVQDIRRNGLFAMQEDGAAELPQELRAGALAVYWQQMAKTLERASNAALESLFSGVPRA